MITNKTLLTLTATILIIFLISTIYSIGLLTRNNYNEPAIKTAKAITSTGNISIRVSTTLSITTIDDSIINFTGCRPGGTIYSNTTGGNNNNDCPGFTPDSIIIRNDGGEPANVTITTSDLGEAQGGTFLNSTTNDSWIAYKITNTTTATNYSGGCYGYYPQNWTNMTAGTMIACDNLSYDATNNSISFDIAFYIPPTVTGGTKELMITFIANPIN